MLKLVAATFMFSGLISSATAEEFAAFEELALPVGRDAREPSLHATDDRRLLMSWTEVSGNDFSVHIAALENGSWSEPRVVTASPDLFVNWADFPSIAAFADGTLIAHWLQISGSSDYDYDVHIALSPDHGESWSAPIVPHADGTNAQHGFVTLMPLEEDVIAIWLDGRAYSGDLVEGGAIAGRMQLRAAVIGSDGAVGADTALDFSTCSCCQTAAAMSGDTLLVAYRDRSEAEVRDIYLTKLQEGRWSPPVSVHDDKWTISGCPVNGPSIAARDNNVVVAWFTGAGDVPAVNLAFSSDAGDNFRDALRIDLGQPVGRVDTLMLDDGSALISWIEWQGAGEALVVCRATAEGCAGSHRLAVNTEGRSMNFPQMAATQEAIYIAWTQPLPDGTDTIRMLRSAR